jgi:prepilin peptidase CpaA
VLAQAEEITVHHALSLTILAVDVLTIGGIAVLVSSALHDFAVRTVPNAYSVVLFAAGIALRLLASGLHGLEWGLVAAAIVFALTFLFWRLGWMGGGDVKLLTAASIFVSPLMVPMMIAGTALAGGVLALIFVVGRRVTQRPRIARPVQFLPRILRCEQWRLHRGGPLPYAAAIAAGGVIATLHG